MSRFFKNRHIFFLLVLVILFSAGVYSFSAHAATIRAEAAQKEQALTITGSLQKMLTMRMSQYQAFASTSLASLPKVDREILNTEIQASLTRMQKTLDDISSTSTATSTSASTKIKSDSKIIAPHISLTQEDTILNMKMNILMNAFKPSAKEMRASFAHSIATTTGTTTKYLAKTKKVQQNTTFKQLLVATSSAQTEIPKRTMPFVFSKTFSVKADLIHQVITAMTIQDIQAVQETISGKVASKKILVEKKVVVPKKEVVTKPESVEPVTETNVTSSTATSTSTSEIDTSTDQATSTPEINTPADQATTTPEVMPEPVVEQPSTTESVVQTEVPVTAPTETPSSTPQTN